ncbi:hypothetical protein FA95DRAFT_1177896 [Auriscalpium vulgare]|uniref:Uncharacterized protein n=1 Tax=Auriscalpium vulgare TaxID=40419 RepID=A0ACB8S997_9AGAM|nr:hypothetical protein FA95DRAFT_1177896 [Auriscalpium vulgare]
MRPVALFPHVLLRVSVVSPRSSLCLYSLSALGGAALSLSLSPTFFPCCHVPTPTPPVPLTTVHIVSYLGSEYAIVSEYAFCLACLSFRHPRALRSPTSIASCSVYSFVA